MEYTFNIKYLGNFLLLIRDATNPSTEKKITWKLTMKKVIDLGLFSTVRLERSRRPDDVGMCPLASLLRGNESLCLGVRGLDLSFCCLQLLIMQSREYLINSSESVFVK